MEDNFINDANCINDILLEDQKEKYDNLQFSRNLSVQSEKSQNSNTSENFPLKKKISQEEIQEKKRLANFFKENYAYIEDIENEDNKIENIFEERIYKDQLAREFITTKEIKDKGPCFLCFMFYILCPILTIINLIGIFEIISVSKKVSKLLIQSVKCFLNWNKCTNIESFDFFNFFFIESLNEPIDYNLMMLLGIFGNILLGLIGFTWSSLIFGVINVGACFMIYNFNFNGYDKFSNSYNILQIGYILVCFVLLSIGVGGSALLSQQILLDSFSKYEEYKKKNASKETDNNENSKNDSKIVKDQKIEKNTKGLTFFFIVCVTTIFGYYGKYLLNIFIARIYKEDNKDKKEFFFWIIIIYISSIGLSLLIYFIFRCSFEEKEDDKKDDKNKKKKSKKRSVYQICGYLIYSETRKNENKKKQHIFCEMYRLICKTIYDCSDKSIFNCVFCGYECHPCLCCCYECDKCCLCCPCSKCCNCCLCCTCCRCCIEGCDSIENIDYEPSNFKICYCYQQKRKFKWINMFVNNETQIYLTHIMFNYFLLQFTTIAFERIYKDNIKKLQKEGNFINNLLDLKRVLISSLLYLIIILLFFYMTISWGIFSRFNINNGKSSKKREEEEEEGDDDNKIFNGTGIILNNKERDEDDNNMKKLSEDIFSGSYIILIFNSIFSLVFSIFYLSKETKLVNIIEDPNSSYILIPILMNNFFYFTFTYYCVKIAEEKKGFELVSGSTLITIYILIWGMIFGTLRDYIPNNLIILLFVMQLIFALPITLYFFFEYSALLFCKGMFWLTFLYLFFYFFAFGGIWFFVCGDCCSCCRCFQSKEKFNNYCKCGKGECDEICKNENLYINCHKKINKIIKFKDYKKEKLINENKELELL